MPRNQPSALKRLTQLFLSLPREQQTAAQEVFAAIVAVPLPVVAVGIEHSAKTAAPKRKPHRKTTPPAAPPAVDTE